MTRSENRRFEAWLDVVDDRLVEVGGENLAQVAEVLESAGKLDSAGLLVELAKRWRRGESVSRAVGAVLAIVPMCDPFRPEDCGDGWRRFLTAVDDGARAAIEVCQQELIAAA